MRILHIPLPKWLSLPSVAAFGRFFYLMALVFTISTENCTAWLTPRYYSYCPATSSCRRIELPSSTRLGETADSEDRENSSTNCKNDSNPTSAKQSRLARLAEDWLEEEEDELLQYWERFDDRTPKALDLDAKPDEIDEENLTTEQRLKRYLDSRGIRRMEEIEHQEEIEAAIQASQKAATADEALQALEAVQPWLQVHTRLGGLALIEYLIATWQESGCLDEDLCRALLKNPHDIVVSKIKRLLQREKPPVRQPSFWGGLFSKYANQEWC